MLCKKQKKIDGVKIFYAKSGDESKGREILTFYNCNDRETAYF